MAFQSLPFVYLWQAAILDRYYLHVCTLHNSFFYLTLSNNTHHSKGAYGSKLKDVTLGGRCKTFYRKKLCRCTLFKRLVNRKTMSKFVNWWILKGSYFGQGCRINLLYASLFFWLTYLSKEVTECRGDIESVKSTPLQPLFDQNGEKHFIPHKNTNQKHCNTFGWGTILLSQSIKNTSKRSSTFLTPCILGYATYNAYLMVD